ncbi:hypothetical protein ACUSIJ_24710 [Pseudochelatococcus sp. B33]
MTTYDLPTLRDLLVRVETADGPDRELDAKIQIAFIPDYGSRVELSPAKFVRFEDVWRRNRAQHLNHANNVADWWNCPKYSASIDAAVALIERALPGAFYFFGKGRLTPGEPLYGARVTPADGEEFDAEHEASLTLAILSALLKALIAREEGREPDTV